MKYILRLTVLLLALVSVAAVCTTLTLSVEAAVFRKVEAKVHRNSQSMRMNCGGNCRACRVAGVLARAGRTTIMQTTRAFALAAANGFEDRRTAVETAPSGAR
jgi:hypothetical protein